MLRTNTILCPSQNPRSPIQNSSRGHVSKRIRTCQAFSARANKQCQKKPFLHSKYCWSHQDKLPWVATLVIGLVVSLVIQEIRDRIRTDPKMDQIIQQTQPISEIADDLKGIAQTVHSSNINVYLKFSVNKPTQNDRDGSTTGEYTVDLVTKSSNRLTYRSPSLATRMIRNQFAYEFYFNAQLQTHENVYRDKPDEFFQAKQIEIPLTRFVDLIRGDLHETAGCKLIHVKIQFYVNNKPIYENDEPLNKDVASSDSLFLDLPVPAKPSGP